MFLISLTKVSGLGYQQIQKLIKYFGSSQAVWEASEKDIILSGCLNKGICDKLLKMRGVNNNPDFWAKELTKKNIKVCSIYDEVYPDKLRHIFNPPVLFYYYGAMIDFSNSIAIVGSRKATSYGKNVAKMLAGEITAATGLVVSGAARGIDTAAHLGALEQGATVAVLGCGIDVVYPPENKKIFDKIKDNGMIISEYYPGTKPNPAYFPCRNRIISGLVNGIVVVEAAEKSGALITAELALSEGRDIFAVPGSIFAEQSRGCNALIKQGAKLVQSSQDILEEYPWAKRIKATEQLTVTPEENAILQLLSAEVGSSIDELVLESQFDISAVSFILLQLELRGLVIKTSYQSYIKIAKEVVF